MRTRTIFAIAIIIGFFCSTLFTSCTHVIPDQRGLIVRPKTPTGEEAKGDLWLITIGIDNYHSWPRLKTATNDAKALKKVLLDRYYIDQSRIIELYNEKATRKNILGTLRDLSKRVHPDDSLMLFYAGHGYIDNITKEGSWIPVESGTNDSSAWISNQDIKDYLNIDIIKTKHILLVSDSCFSGNFFLGSNRAIPEVTDDGIKKAYQLSSRQAIISGGLEPVSDAKFGENSVFSHFLIAALQDNTKPYLTPSDLFSAIKSSVAQNLEKFPNGEQFPRMGSISGVGGQQGGEMVLFLRQKNQGENLSAGTAQGPKGSEGLKSPKEEGKDAKVQEQSEIAKKEQELETLNREIAEMKERLKVAKSDGSLDQLVALDEQIEKLSKRLEDLRREREAEERKRQLEVERLKREALKKKAKQVEIDLAKYRKVVSSRYNQNLKETTWNALIAEYPEAKNVPLYNEEKFLRTLGIPLPHTDKAANIEMVPILGGCYQMGDTFGNGRTNETPVHEVCVGDFYLGKYEVTQGQWKAIMGNSPASFRNGDNYPVDNVSWNDAQEFIRKLNKKTGKKYRLTTEEEWEYAARSGGNKEKWAGTSNESELGDYAWYNKNSGNEPHPVGEKRPNGLGLYDMSGNVWEWCQNIFSWDAYKHDSQKNPIVEGSGGRVLRGGSWGHGTWNVRVTDRNSLTPETRYVYCGFRIARDF
jgi:formylglycine-generating enzyme required for sulfatase activity